MQKRIITAIALISLVLLGIFFAPTATFIWIVLILTALAAWEWSNLADFRSESWRSVYVLVVLLLSGLYLTWPTPEAFSWLWLVFWFALGFSLVFYPKCENLFKPTTVRALIGFMALVPWPASLVAIRAGENGIFYHVGSLDLLIVLVLVWCVDTGAYFIGRRFGKTKLAPFISPNKTIAGFWGGMFLPMVVAILISLFMPFSLSRLEHAIYVTFAIVIFAVVGDLSESMFKRIRGVKDSGELLPGHGGLLDRIDSLLPVITLYASLITLGIGS